MAEKSTRSRTLMKWFLFRIPIGLIILGVILIGALKLVEGYPDPLKQGFERYISDSTGRSATIGKLEQVKFFPNFIIDANSITIHNGSNAAIIDVEVENFYVSSPLASMFGGFAKFNDLKVKNLTALENVFGPQKIKVDTAEIVVKDGPDQYGSFLSIVGKIGDKDASILAELEAGKYSYKVPSKLPFSFKVDDYEVNAIQQRNFRSVTLENVVLKNGDRQSEAKTFLFSGNGATQKDNPVACLYLESDLSKCNVYF